MNLYNYLLYLFSVTYVMYAHICDMCHREGQRQCYDIHHNGPLLLSDTSKTRSGILPNLLSLHTAWTRYYRFNRRDPSIVNEIAPWVQNRINHFRGLIESSKNVAVDSKIISDKSHIG